MAVWAEVEGWGKAHPVGLGVAIFVGGAIILYLFWPSSAAQPAATGPSDAYYNAVASMAASGNQLQIAQLQAQQDANATQAAVTTANNQIAGQVSVATINGQTATSVAAIQATQDNYDVAQQAATAQLASTLNAQIQTAGYNTAQNIAAINAGAATTQAQINANAYITNSNNQATVAESSIAAQNYQAGLGAEVQRYQAYNTIASSQLAASLATVVPAGSTLTSSGGNISITT